MMQLVEMRANYANLTTNELGCMIKDPKMLTVKHEIDIEIDFDFFGYKGKSNDLL